jgi:dipeptidase E
MKKLIIASTSTIYGSGYLEYIIPTLESFFSKVSQIVFIPYARPGGISYDAYTAIVRDAFSKIDKEVKGIHEFIDSEMAIQNAEAIFTGGGNTFLLVDTIYEQKLFPAIKNAVENGTLYFGTSAGSNIAGINMKTTNDMPIVYPDSFDTLGLIPLNINPHYLDPDQNSKHKGETRETRIKEFHTFNETPVLGLREGSWLEVTDDVIILRGSLTARLFRQGKKPIELMPESMVNTEI